MVGGDGKQGGPREVHWGPSVPSLHVVHCETASRKSIPFKVKRTENAAGPGKFLL